MSATSPVAPRDTGYEPVPDAVGADAPLPDGARKIPCECVEEVLFSYMARELGPAQSMLVREHLRRCPSCRAKAADIRRTLEILGEHDPAADAPGELSPKRRRRVMWTRAHPVLDFIFVHHALASLAVALAAAALVLWYLFTHVGVRDPFKIFWVRMQGDPSAEESQGVQPPAAP